MKCSSIELNCCVSIFVNRRVSFHQSSVFRSKNMASELFSSTIIPTIGRTSLNRAVMSVLDQEFDRQDFEVIVVNDSGHSLPDANWMRSERVRMIETNRR